ncbi:MAG: DUF1552 domain-containing protein [Deltaproteobacteria bacterium]|nr:DUF1552 domain-containing protein [Deltaproteobacteria bacterium]
MKKFVTTRRQVLRGTGGFTLGLPFLPSLVERPSLAAELGRQPVFAAICSVHGACKPENMYPNETLLTQSKEIFPGYTVKYGDLAPGVNNGQLSRVMRGAGLTAQLAAKLNVIRGIDYPYYSGHHSGQLGNFAVNDQGPGGLKQMASIDQVMAWSPSFYKDTSGIKMRSVVTGRGGFQMPCSFAWANPTLGSGAVNRVGLDGSAKSLFDKLVAGAPPSTPGAPARKPIIDRVIENYRTLKQSNRRLSAEDKARLDAHVTHLAELERQLTAPPPRVCGGTTLKGDTANLSPGGEGGKTLYPLLNDVIVAALACGTTRVVTIGVPSDSFNTFGGGYHQSIAHQAGGDGPQQTVVSVHQAIFEFVFLDLVKKLDAVTLAPGRTLLDDAMVQWTQEAGWETHAAQDGCVMMAGSASGYFKTGLFVDYRGTKKMKLFGGFQQQRLGLLHRQWLATALQAMGVPKAEWEKFGRVGYGYGDPFMDPGYSGFQLASVFEKASDPAPIISMG